MINFDHYRSEVAAVEQDAATFLREADTRQAWVKTRSGAVVAAWTNAGEHAHLSGAALRVKADDQAANEWRALRGERAAALDKKATAVRNAIATERQMATQAPAAPAPVLSREETDRLSFEARTLLLETRRSGHATDALRLQMAYRDLTLPQQLDALERAQSANAVSDVAFLDASVNRGIAAPDTPKALRARFEAVRESRLTPELRTTFEQLAVSLEKVSAQAFLQATAEDIYAQDHAPSNADVNRLFEASRVVRRAEATTA